MGLSNNHVYLQVFFVILLIAFSSAGIITIVDNFAPNAAPVQCTNQFSNETCFKYKSSNGNDTIGIERDLIVKLLSGTSGRTVVSSVADFVLAFGYEQQAEGWCIAQYDGFDNSPNITYPGLNGTDLTAGDSAFAFYLVISSDLPGIFQINVYGNQVTNTSVFTFIFTPPYADAIQALTIPFTSFVGTASFKEVYAIEFLLNVTPPIVNPINSNLFTFALIGYGIFGQVYYDCNKNGIFDVSEIGFSGVTVNLLVNQIIVQTTVTDGTGNYQFVGLANGTYSVCVVTPNGASATNPLSGCSNNLILDNATDVTNLLFGYFVQTVITPPPNTQVSCGSCILPFDNCTGQATGVGCGGNNPVITSSDSVSNGVCPQTITRTFSSSGAASVTQIITVTDTNPPVIVIPGSDVSTSCSLKNPTINAWVNTHAGASATDCNSITWSSNWNGTAASNCGSYPVNFTASDPCGNKVSFTNFYNTSDTVAPQFTKTPQPQNVQCDIHSNSVANSFTTWLNNHGGATAVDNCASVNALIWTNDSPGTITQSCNSNSLVTFTVNDGCGNSNSSSGIFTVLDTTPPTIVTPAQNISISCSGDVQGTYTNWLLNNGDAVVTDNCASSGFIWNNNAAPSPSGCNFAIPVTFTVDDPCGNSAVTTATFTVISSTGPLLVKPASSLSVDCTIANNSTDSANTIKNWLKNNGGASAVDNCTGVVWQNNFVQVIQGNCVGTPVTFTACNLCTPQQCVSTIANITITDFFPPQFIQPPQSVTVSCDVYAEQQFNTWLATAGNATITDNCSPPQSIVITNTWPPGRNLTNGCNNAATVSFFATDACGNKSPAQVATFRVIDDQPPVITPAQNLTFECDDSIFNSYNTWLNSHGGATGTDPCGNVTWTYNGPKTISKGCNVTNTVVFTATDTCGLTSSTTATFTVVNSDPPRLTHEATDLNTTCSTTLNQTLSAWLADHGGATAVDDCTNVTWTYNFQGLSGGCTQSALVTFVASNQCGFSTATTATFAVVDNQPPIITTPAQSVSYPCDSNTGNEFTFFLNSHGGAVAIDACQPSEFLQWSSDYATAPTSCQTISVTFQVTDGCGRYATTTGQFTVTDSSAPEIIQPALNVSVQCDGSGNVNQYNFWVANHGGAQANDGCALNVTWSSDAPLNGPVGCGSVTVDFGVIDGCGNFNTTTATFTVIDSQPPSIVTPAQNTVVTCDGYGNAAEFNLWLESHAGANATDSCSANNIIWTYEFSTTVVDTFSCTEFNTYTFFASDACGNSVATSASFGITDNSGPTLVTPPSDLILTCGTNNTAAINSWIASNGGMVVEDFCSNVTFSNDYTPQVNPGFGCFVLPVTFYAVDFCGHVVSQTANIRLEDNTKPQFVNFPANLTLPCDADTSTTYTGFPGVTDNCFSNLASQITYVDSSSNLPPDPNTPLCPGNLVIKRTFSVTDPCNNTNSQSQYITVEIARSAGPCDSSQCHCDNECCPTPKASDCLAVDCLPQNCAATYCEAVQCSCDLFSKRDLNEFAVDFENSPIPQCEPIYVFVHDDDAGDDDDNDSVSLGKPTLNNYLISDRPIPQEELEKIKNNKLHKKASKQSEAKPNSVVDSILKLF